jgi:hypothetical protein
MCTSGSRGGSSRASCSALLVPSNSSQNGSGTCTISACSSSNPAKRPLSTLAAHRRGPSSQQRGGRGKRPSASQPRRTRTPSSVSARCRDRLRCEGNGRTRDLRNERTPWPRSAWSRRRRAIPASPAGPPSGWRPFHRRGWRRFVYGDPGKVRATRARADSPSPRAAAEVHQTTKS